MAIKNLTNNKEIMIKPANKESAVVVMNRKDYLSEGYKQVSDTKLYKKVDTDLTAHNTSKTHH